MTSHDLSEVGRRYLFLKTELQECPELINDDDFMRKYDLFHKMYKHYHRHSRQTQKVKSSFLNDRDSSNTLTNKTADTHNWHGFINEIRRYNDYQVK
jgi:hypothetical protein